MDQADDYHHLIDDLTEHLMPNLVNKAICAIRGYHKDELCRTFHWHDIGITEHTHVCEDCQTRTIAEIRRIEPTQEIPIETVMGLQPEQQSDFFH